MATPLPDKLFFKIGEVAELVGVKPHVLRYWETELGVLRPLKTRGAHRMYKRRDVELALVIRRLLQDEGYTIPGARRKLREVIRGRPGASAPANDSPPAAKTATPAHVDAAGRELALRAELIALRRDLVAIAARLAPEPAPSEQADGAHADVHERVDVAVVAAVPAPFPPRF